MAANPESILESVKKILGFEPEYTAFDLDIVTHINTAFGILRQLGVGPSEGFVIQNGTSLWSAYSSDMALLISVKSYIYMIVRLLFDPPATSFALDSAQKIKSELEWRLNVEAETINPPLPPVVYDEPVFEGGTLTTFFSPKVVLLYFASVVVPDASDGNVFYLTLAGNCTIEAPVNGVDGQHITLELTSNGYSVTWGTGWNFGGAGLPVLSPDGTDIISAVFRYPFAEWHAGYTSGF